MTVTAAAGFEAAGVAAGLKSSGARDLALVVNRGPLQSGAAVFTSNRAVANPIIWSRQVGSASEASLRPAAVRAAVSEASKTISISAR